MEYQTYMQPELFILVPVLSGVGCALKRSRMPDYKIPFVLGGLSILLSFFWLLATETILNLATLAHVIFTAITQGILAAGVSVYTNQLYKQTKKEE